MRGSKIQIYLYLHYNMTKNMPWTSLPHPPLDYSQINNYIPWTNPPTHPPLKKKFLICAYNYENISASFLNIKLSANNSHQYTQNSFSKFIPKHSNENVCFGLAGYEIKHLFWIKLLYLEN